MPFTGTYRLDIRQPSVLEIVDWSFVVPSVPSSAIAQTFQFPAPTTIGRLDVNLHDPVGSPSVLSLPAIRLASEATDDIRNDAGVAIGIGQFSFFDDVVGA